MNRFSLRRKLETEKFHTPGGVEHDQQSHGGESGGSVKTKIPHDKALQFATNYIELHNKASKEFKEAFKKVGARMWHDDDAHEIRPKSAGFIAEQVSYGFSGYSIERPLTVLDAYPQVTKEQRRWLNKEVDRIQKSYIKKLLPIKEATFGKQGEL